MPDNKPIDSRMKENYEHRSRYYLPRRTYTIIRVDGKAFHTFTRGCDKPFDMNLIRCMDGTAQHMCSKIQGAAFAFVQSDEISILVTVPLGPTHFLVRRDMFALVPTIGTQSVVISQGLFHHSGPFNKDTNVVPREFVTEVTFPPLADPALRVIAEESLLQPQSLLRVSVLTDTRIISVWILTV